MRLWDVQTGQETRQFEGHTDRAGDVVFAPTVSALLSSSTDQTLRLWDTRTGQELRRCEVGADAGWAVAISPDGHRALSVHDADVILWDLDNSQQIHRFQGHADQVTGLAFSPDGRTALSSSRDGSVRLWGLPSGSNPTPPEPQVLAQNPKPEGAERQTRFGGPGRPGQRPKPSRPAPRRPPASRSRNPNSRPWPSCPRTPGSR